jgi:hypothetical protein
MPASCLEYPVFKQKVSVVVAFVAVVDRQLLIDGVEQKTCLPVSA